MDPYAANIMRSVRAVLCILLTALIPGLSVVGNALPAEKVDRVRTGMTVGGAFWGGISGIPAGAVTVPIISIYMDF